MVDSPWAVGDIISRDGTDEQRIVSIDFEYGVVYVTCVKEPAVGDSGGPWCEVGDEDSNLIRRYTFVRRGEKHGA